MEDCDLCQMEEVSNTKDLDSLAADLNQVKLPPKSDSRTIDASNRIRMAKIHSYNRHSADIADVAALTFTSDQFLDVEDGESMSSIFCGQYE
jgi:hypothetical protein